MSTHELKTWPAYFAAIRDGSKTFEIRKFDRDFACGDTLILKEYDPHLEKYTGRKEVRTVTYLCDDELWCKPGYCVMGLKP